MRNISIQFKVTAEEKKKLNDSFIAFLATIKEPVSFSEYLRLRLLTNTKTEEN